METTFYYYGHLTYFTLYVSADDFTNRNRISVTVLLAMFTLFGSTALKSDFPKTTFLKCVDIWFIYYLTSVFMIVCHHIMIERLVQKSSSQQTNRSCRVHPQGTTTMDGENERILGYQQSDTYRPQLLNKAAIIAFPVVMVLFHSVYFYLTIFGSI